MKIKSCPQPSVIEIYFVNGTLITKSIEIMYAQIWVLESALEFMKINIHGQKKITHLLFNSSYSSVKIVPFSIG